MSLSPPPQALPLLPAAPTPRKGLRHLIPGAASSLHATTFLRCVEPPGCFQVVHQLGWEIQSGAMVFGAGRWHRGPADHTSSRQISFLGGLALNEGVNWLMKHVIKEPRPCGGEAQAAGIGGPPGWGITGACSLPSCPVLSPPDPHATVGTKYGMPSSHSQFMWFFSVYSFLFLYLR